MNIIWLLVCAFFASKTIAQDTQMDFQYPLAVAAAADGSVYIADRKLPGIWRLKDGQKEIYFQASKKYRSPLNAIRCLAIDHQGRLLAGDTSTREIYRFDADGKPNALTNGWPGMPMSLAVDNDGNIFIADTEVHRIWKIPPQGTGKPEEVAAINSPRGLTFDANDQLIVLSVSSRQGQIQKLNPDGKLTPIVKGHPFEFPHKIVRAADGAFYITDNYKGGIWKVTPDGTKEQWFMGKPFDRPVGLCLNATGKGLIVTDPHPKTIYAVGLDKTITVLAKPNETPAK